MHLPPSQCPADASQYTVVKGVISKERAAEYVDRMYKWLEGFGKGFKADDRSTWHVNQLPEFNKLVVHHTVHGIANTYELGEVYSTATRRRMSNSPGISVASRLS